MTREREREGGEVGWSKEEGKEKGSPKKRPVPAGTFNR